MPIYEYQCNDCNEKFEVTLSTFPREKPRCPKCRSEKTRRIFSSASRISEPSKPSSGFG